MNFLIGGAHQGKLYIAKEKFDIEAADIFTCDSGEIDFSKRCIYHVENFSLWCVRHNKEAKDFFEEHKAEWQDSTIICEDIFCGVVPVDEQLRAWREMTGRLCTYFTREADTVTRVFCGLEQKLK